MLKTTSKREKRLSPPPLILWFNKMQKICSGKIILKNYILLKTSLLDIPSFNAEFSGISEVFLELPAQRPGTWVPLRNPTFTAMSGESTHPFKYCRTNDLILVKMSENTLGRTTYNTMNCQVKYSFQKQHIKMVLGHPSQMYGVGTWTQVPQQYFASFTELHCSK